MLHDEIAAPLPVERLLDEIFREPSGQDRAGVMRGYFIDILTF